MTGKLGSKLKKRSVTVTIIFFFTLLVIIPYFLLVELTYRSYMKKGMESLGQTAEDSMISTGTQISQTLRQIEDATMTVYYGDCVDLLSEERTLSEREIKGINSSLNTLRWSNSGIRAAYIVDGDQVYGGVIFRDVIGIMKPHEEEILNAKGTCLWYWTYDLGGRAGECKFILARALNSEDQRQVGILYVVVDNYAVTSVIRNLTSSSVKYLTDASGSVIYSTDASQVRSTVDVSLFEGPAMSAHHVTAQSKKEKQLIAARRIPDTGWYCCSLIDVDQALSTARLVPFYILFMAVCYGILLLLMIILMNHFVFQPLARLKKTMDEYADGSLEVMNIAPVGTGEFKSLSTHFNQMTERIDSLMKAYREETEEKNRQSMRALTAQMTPHFTYNALNTIKWLAVINHQKNIQDLVESLIYVFRSVSRADDGTYTVGDELELVKNYSVIQKARFMNFELKIDCEEGCRDLRFRKMLLQPIVENAIIHGLGRGSIRDTDIELHVWKDRLLHITVRDRGCGFDVDRWRHEAPKDEEHTGLGIHSIEEMIRLSYGEGFGLRIDSRIGEGTVVTYLLPVLQGGTSGDDTDSNR